MHFLTVFWADNGIRTHSFDTLWYNSPESYTHVVKPVFRGHLWDTGKVPYKTGDVLIEVQFIWNCLWHDKKNVTFWYRWLLNRGDRMGRLDCNYILLYFSRWIGVTVVMIHTEILLNGHNVPRVSAITTALATSPRNVVVTWECQSHW